MRAVTYDRYGPPDVLRVQDVPIPMPGPDQVLVEVVATSVNLSDWEALRGEPMYARIAGLRAPARRTLGSDIAGRVVAVGSGVTGFRPGDEVYGGQPAAQGRVRRVRRGARIGARPQTGGVDVRRGLNDPAGRRHRPAGHQRCPSRAAGADQRGRRGLGAFAIQLARQAGAHATGVDNDSKLAFMRSLGPDEVVDYQREDFTLLPPFDHMLDLVAHRSVFAYRRALARGGRYRCVGGSVRALLRVLTVGALLGVLTGRRMGVLAVREGPAHFKPVAERCLAGELAIHIDETFALDDVPRALAHVGEGRALGKVVVEVP